MRVIDLTHTISPDMPVYPGSNSPVLQQVASLDEEKYIEKKLTLNSHTGTHIDAPSHIIATGKTLDDYPPAAFCGPAVVLNLSHIIDRKIEKEDLLPYSVPLERVQFLLIHTGWSCYWGDKKYFLDPPVLSIAAAKWLATLRLKGIGVDTLSVDSNVSIGFPIHKTFLSCDTLIIENLTNLGRLTDKIFEFYCFPLKLAQADGSPVRAVAIVNDVYNPS
jgi:kynurenine formamidase